jgi:CRP/FNR family transcriptional regulator
MTAHPSRSERSSLPEVCKLLRLPAIPGAGRIELEFLHRRVKAGSRLCSQGEPLEALFVIRSGCMKTFVNDECGNQVVVGFPSEGDLVGADGLFNRTYATYAVALNDIEVVVIPFTALATLGRALDDFELLLYRAISRELVTEHAVRSVVNSLRAEARVARFIAHFADRQKDLGRDGRRFTLPMTRQEIGSYLGLTLETVSRAFSGLHDAGLVQVTHRDIAILDEAALKTLQKLPTSTAGTRGPGARRVVARPVRRNVTWSEMLGSVAA